MNLIPWRRPAQAAARVEPTLEQLPAVLPRNETLVMSGDPAVMSIFGAPATYTGRPVTESSSMQHGAVYACTRLIGGTTGSLQIDVYRRDGERREKINEKDDIWWLLNEQPHPRWTATNLWKRTLYAEMLRGDGLIEIQRSRNGMPIGLRPMPPDCTIDLKDDRLVYYFPEDGGKRRGLDQDDVIHIPGYGFDGVRGQSVISWGARNGIGIGLATDEYAARFFGSGAAIQYALLAKQKVDEPMQNRLRAQWEERYAGLENAFRPVILPEGMDVKELSLTAHDAQLLEARKYSVIDIARCFGVPPILIGESEKTSTWGGGVEQVVLSFLKFSLADRLVTIEQELNRKLFRTRTRMVEFNVDRLLRGDAASRSKFLREMVGGSQGPGIITVNEARSGERLSPVEGGDELYDPTKAALTLAEAAADEKPDDKPPGGKDEPA